MHTQNTIRLDKYLANMGVVSRRKVEEFITQNQVTLNGQPVTEPGIRFNPHTDQLLINHQPLSQPKPEYLLLYKPVGVVSSASTQQDHPTVLDLISSDQRLYPVGRLDKDSEGLVLLTNDGELAYRLTHPKFHIPKTYHVTVKGQITLNKLNQLSHGIELSDGKTAPAQLSRTGTNSFTITIHQGKNRQIRRMCAALDLHVTSLKRISIGTIKLDNLKPGQSRHLNKSEIQDLKHLL